METQHLVIANILTIALFILKELWDFFKSSTKENTKETIKNTMAIAELKVHINLLNDKLDRLAVLEKKIDHVDDRVDDVVNSIVNMYSAKSSTKQ